MPSSHYIDLLKKTLIDSGKIGGVEYHPLTIVNPHWKTAPLFWLDKLLRLRNFAIGKMKFVAEEKRLNGMDWPAQAKTMIGLKRLDNIEDCMTTVLKENIPGDFIETGVWRGGATILMRAILKEQNVEDRKVWLADSFQGLPPPDVRKYKADKGNQLHRQKILKRFSGRR